MEISTTTRSLSLTFFLSESKHVLYVKVCHQCLIITSYLLQNLTQNLKIPKRKFFAAFLSKFNDTVSISH